MPHAMRCLRARALGCMMLLALVGEARAEGLTFLGVGLPSATPSSPATQPARDAPQRRVRVFLGRTPDGRDVATVLVLPGTTHARVVDVLERVGINLVNLPFDIGNVGSRIMGFETQWSPRTYWDGCVQLFTKPVSWVRARLRSRRENGVEVIDTWKQRSRHPDETATSVGRISVAVVTTMVSDLFVTPYRFATTKGSEVGGPTNQELADSLTNWTLLVAGVAAMQVSCGQTAPVLPAAHGRPRQRRIVESAEAHLRRSGSGRFR